MPSLETLNLVQVGLRPRPTGARHYRGWFHVFDTIRNHPRTLQLNFHVIRFHCWEIRDFVHNTRDFERYLNPNPRGDGAEVGRRCLALYLGGKSELDDTTRLWFDRDDSPDV